MTVMTPALLLALQVVAKPIPSPADDRPVRLWLGASPVLPGAAVPVYVSAAQEGFLLVLRVATDGRVHVVFPNDPASDGHVGPGTYELRASGDRPALVTTEPPGTGLVLAAVSATPYRFGEFVRGGAWHQAALRASWPGADGAGALTDIAQRMLGDGWFNYALALYTVRSETARAAVAASQARALTLPPVGSAAAPDIGECNGCTVVYETVMPPAVVEQTVIEQTIVQPVVILPTLCEPFVGACRRHGRRARPPQPPVKTSGICNVGVDCPEGVGAPARALLVPRRASLVMSPRRRPVPPPVAPPAVPPAASRVVRLAAPVTAPAPAAAPHAPRATTSRTIALYSAPLRRAAMAAPASRPSPAAVAAPARRSGTMVLPRPVTKQRAIATARGSARPR